MNGEFDRYITDERKVFQWRSPLTWSILIALGWLIYEVTAQPVLGAVVACLKFGWEDYLTGRWLRRVDPDRRRGQVCYHTYLAYGFLKIAVAAIFIVCGILALEESFKRPAPPRQGAAAGAQPQAPAAKDRKGELFIALTVLTGVLGFYLFTFT